MTWSPRPLRSKRGLSLALIALVVSPLFSTAAWAHSPGAAFSPRSSTGQSGTVIPGTHCPAFPADNVWNTPITGLPVNAESATWLAAMDSSSTYLHPDYGPSGDAAEPYGISWTIVSARTNSRTSPSSTRPKLSRSLSLHRLDSIENGSDRHALMVDPYPIGELAGVHPL